MKRYFAILCRWIPILTKYFCGFLSLNLFHRELLKKDIWLITEKYGEARDNGYHFFKYVRTTHPEINAFFVITDDSPDREKVAQYGNIISQDSKEHMLYFLAAKYSISSQIAGAHLYNKMIPEIFRLLSLLTRKDQKCIFLQHGIIKDAMPDKRFFHKERINDLFVTSTRREQEFVQKEYGYPDGYVQELGLCRFDNLHHTDAGDEKLVLVMPTWRSWLKTHTGTDAEKQAFIESEYCRTYVNLLKSERLKSILKSSGYKLIFYPHYGAQRYIEAFMQCNSEHITVASKNNYDVQDL
ncbi:MAG: CDP-glycerol glycerophosphotransferase family protein, partial [Clostridia bacterium]|nr:CDP-glycerol glycerophosphotransferase family protein [Clostridia bacterium]